MVPKGKYLISLEHPLQHGRNEKRLIVISVAKTELLRMPFTPRDKGFRAIFLL
jgi:hypothetical protein